MPTPCEPPESAAHTTYAAASRALDTMAQQQLFEENGRKLLSPNVGLAEKLAIVVDIRERIEVVHGKECARFLHYLFPAFRALLMEEIPPQFLAGPANKIIFVRSLRTKIWTNKIYQKQVSHLYWVDGQQKRVKRVD